MAEEGNDEIQVTTSKETFTDFLLLVVEINHRLSSEVFDAESRGSGPSFTTNTKRQARNVFELYYAINFRVIDVSWRW
jgi:hypothetical protein